jgi:hypothetical protein
VLGGFVDSPEVGFSSVTDAARSLALNTTEESAIPVDMLSINLVSPPHRNPDGTQALEAQKLEVKIDRAIP